MKLLSLLTLSGVAKATIHSRKLAFEKIAGYEPLTLVTDHVSLQYDCVLCMTWLVTGFPGLDGCVLRASTSRHHVVQTSDHVCYGKIDFQLLQKLDCKYRYRQIFCGRFGEFGKNRVHVAAQNVVIWLSCLASAIFIYKQSNNMRVVCLFLNWDWQLFSYLFFLFLLNS